MLRSPYLPPNEHQTLRGAEKNCANFFWLRRSNEEKFGTAIPMYGRRTPARQYAQMHAHVLYFLAQKCYFF